MNFNLATLTITAEKVEGGGTMTLPKPIELEVVSSYDSPARSFEGIFPWEQEYPELYRITVTLDGGRFFYGVIDEQVLTENDEGRTLKISARSKGAALLDNEAKPQLYEYITMQTIFNNHARPYGFTTLEDNLNPMFNSYRVEKGMSEWEVLYNFYQSSALGTVIIDENDVIRCKIHPLHEQVFYISNSDPAADTQFSNFKTVNNRYAPISRFLVRDKAGAYSYTYSNKEAADYRLARTRYLVPAVQFTVSDNGGINEASLRVRQSMLSKQVITVTCPGFCKVKVCDRAEVHGTIVAHYGRFVHQVRYRLSAGGAETTLTLLEFQYV